VAERKRVRDALVTAGRADEARAVAKRRRPTASVWAVNQLARRAPEDVEELLALGDSLRAGERKLMRGGSAEGFMEDARTARQKVAALARRAEALVEESGQKATATLGRKISQTLHAASIADDETRARLAAGRLDEDLAPPSSFGAGGDLATTLAASLGAKPKKSKSAAAAERKHSVAERERVVDEVNHSAAERTRAAAERTRAAAERTRAAGERKRAAAEVRAHRREQAAARKHAAALSRAAKAADRVVADRERAVERARTAVERAEAELRAAKDALVDAETAATAAHRALDDAR
jgi:hypothetical protein